MKLIPSKRIIYISKLSSQEIKNELGKHIEPMRTLSFAVSRKFTAPYQGEIAGERFKLLRNIKGHNSFQARVSGIIRDEKNGTKITVLMEVLPFVRAFMYVWLIAVSAFCLLIIGITIFDSQAVNVGFIIPFLMLILGFFLPRMGFNPEAKIIESDLKKIFKAELSSKEIQKENRFDNM